jgi:hypothetical protein
MRWDRRKHPLEGSCQETILPLPQHLTTFFRCALLGELHPRLVASDTSLFSFAWCQLCGRRTKHPSRSRPRDVSPAGQTSAPGIVHAPENRRYPAASNRVPLTNAMAPLRVQFQYGSRQRRRQTQPSVGRPSGHGLRSGRIKRLVVNHFSYPSLPQPNWWLNLSQKPCSHQRAPGLTSCNSTPAPVYGPRIYAPASGDFWPVSVGKTAAPLG